MFFFVLRVLLFPSFIDLFDIFLKVIRISCLRICNDLSTKLNTGRNGLQTSTSTGWAMKHNKLWCFLSDLHLKKRSYNRESGLKKTHRNLNHFVPSLCIFWGKKVISSDFPARQKGCTDWCYHPAWKKYQSAEIILSFVRMETNIFETAKKLIMTPHVIFLLLVECIVYVCMCMYIYIIGTSIIMCIYNYICITLYNWL